MTIDKYDLIIFDLDGTLTESKSPIDSEMAELMTKLIAIKKVAVISGGGYPQFETQFLKSWSDSQKNFNNLFIVPTSGTQLYAWRGKWSKQYEEDLTEKEKEKVIIALEETLKSVGYKQPERIYGPLTEDRGSQITFSALGQRAPFVLKAAWDPNREKREHAAQILQKKLPNFDVRIGGSTSLDITKRGVNKAYGIRKLESFLEITSDKILFVGDTLFHGGNDYPARATNVDCIQVKDPSETKAFIREWLA